MKTLGDILSSLNSEGFRITRARKAILEAFLSNGKPLSAEELIEGLRQRGINSNKTTVYRELGFLKDRKIIQEVQFLHERLKRFEIIEDNHHHHHLICLSCKKVEDIELKDELRAEEERIFKSTGFKVLNHSLEFMGLCPKCL